eukprot:Em0140g2a
MPHLPRPFLALVQMEVAGLVAHLVKVMEQVVKVIALSGTNGSQLQDSAFAAQAFLEARVYLDRRFSDCTCARKPPNYSKYYRQMSKVLHSSGRGLLQSVIGLGTFPFSTVECGWVVSGQKGGYASYKLPTYTAMKPPLAPNAHSRSSINMPLPSTTVTLMNMLKTKGCSTVSMWDCLSRALKYVLSIQKPDGSWEGSWGVCFTYGTWFGLEALGCMGRRFDLG